MSGGISEDLKSVSITEVLKKDSGYIFFKFKKLSQDQVKQSMPNTKSKAEQANIPTSEAEHVQNRVLAYSA